VLRIGFAYLAGSWLLVQVAETLFPVYGIDDSVIKLMVSILAIGFPIALVLAWVFEWTPDGIRPESDVENQSPGNPAKGERLNRIIIIFLLLGIGFFAADKFILDPARDQEIARTAAEAARQEVLLDSYGENSIAVLPFRDMSEGADQQYFSDGIAEEILNALVRVEGLKAASRTSSFSYRGDDLNLKEIAEELKVDHILEGSVRRGGARVRISAQLVDARTDRQLWAEAYDRDASDVLAIQGEIANAIVLSLKQQLGLDIDESSVSIASRTDNADAYDLYLNGRALILSRDNMNLAIELLEKAVGLDPDFAKAWEVLGAAYFIAPNWGYEFDTDTLKQAENASRRALELDDQLSLPWSVLSSVGMYRGELSYEEALVYDRRAIAADPKNATSHLWLALNLSGLGRLDEAVRLVETCLEIDPAYQNCKRHLAYLYYIAGRESEALRLFYEGVEAGFNGNEVLFLGLVLRHDGRRAASLLAQGFVSGQRFPVKDLLDLIEHPDDDHSHARNRFRSIMQDLEWRNGFGANQTAAYFGLYDEAARSVGDVPGWIWSPDIADFRKSDAFKSLVSETGMVAYWRKHGFPPQCRLNGEDDFECE
jgi:TolB-like protein/Tfp pilus assembly protein PilF